MTRIGRLAKHALAIVGAALAPLSWGVSASADDAAPSIPAASRTMTLAQAVAHARTHLPAIRAALSRVEAQEQTAKVPRAQWLPTFGVTAQWFAATANNTTGTSLTPSFMDIPRIGGTRVTSSGSWSPYASTFAGLGVTQEAYDFGRIAAQAAAEDARVDIERERADAELLGVAFDVEEAYFAVFTAKQVVVASDDAYERSLVHRNLAKAGVDSGLRSPIELTRADADLARLDIGRIRARGSVAAAEEVLGATVGSPELSIDVPDAAPPPREMPDLASILQRAAARDPRILQALAQWRAEERRTEAIAAEGRPDLALTGTLATRAGGAPPSGNGEYASGRGWIPNVPNWDIGVVFSWPIFDATVDARVEASRAREQVRREDVNRARQSEIAAIRQAYGAVVVARAALPGLQHAVEAARANYAQADARFRAGLGTSVELADAENLRTDADIQLALGIFEIARARAALGRAAAEGT